MEINEGKGRFFREKMAGMRILLYLCSKFFNETKTNMNYNNAAPTPNPLPNKGGELLRKLLAEAPPLPCRGGSWGWGQ